MNFAIAVTILISANLIGLLLFLNPAFAIELQRKFYEKINWRIEPISMPREVRNTRIMGLFLLLVALLTVVILFANTLHDNYGLFK